MPILVISTKREVRVLEAGSALKAEPDERVLWLGCKDTCTPDADGEAVALTPRPLV
jgi:hypothetical protein